MKIGILTFTDTTNYGASLQAYALQQALTGKGQQVEIISYTNENVYAMHDPYGVFKWHGVKKLLAPFAFRVYRKRQEKFKEFEGKYCTFSNRCEKATFAKFTGRYDRIVVGSDQVWNTDITGDDRTFFLDSIPDRKKKYSYAASVGTGYFSNNAGKYEKLLKEFSLISVREEETAETLKKSIGRDDVTCDVDPTLLIRHQWIDFVNDENPYGDYILMYLTPEGKDLLNAVREFARKAGCKIILLKKSVVRRKGIRVINVASPADFINLVAHAKHIVTGSFHALCFSIIFEKSFYTTSSTEKSRHGRLVNMLNVLGLTDRNISGPDYRFAENKIDYHSVNNRLDEEVKKSLKTIEKICQE